MNKNALTGIAGLRTLQKKPKAVTIGTDAEGFFKRLGLDEFFDIQERLMTVENDFPKLSEEDAKDDKKVIARNKAIANATKAVVIDLMIGVMTDEKGEPAFAEKDREELQQLVTASFSRDFINSLIRSQGVTQEEIASAEANFRQ